MIEVVARYPEEGFDILEDEHGRFLLLDGTDEIIDLEE